MRPEQSAFLEKLYRESFGQLWSYAMAALNDKDRAEEVVQDAFHEAVKQIGTVMNHENPKAWLMQTVKHKVLHANRSFNRYNRRFTSLDDDLQQGGAYLGKEDAAPANVHEIIKKIQEVLTEDEWSLLRKIALEKRTYKEVAAELSTTVWACQKRIQRIREKLRIELSDYFE